MGLAIAFKNFDPRVGDSPQVVHRRAAAARHQEPAAEIAMQLEDIALKDEFHQPQAYSNVDFYWGIAP
jgi:citrate synthase